MKPSNISFLFFYCICSLFLVMPNSKVIAQQSQDSLVYYSNLALKPQNTDDFFKTKKYFDVNYKIALNNKDTVSAVNCLYYMASLQHKSGSYDESETTIVTALKLLDKSNNSTDVKKIRKSFNNLLGIIFGEQNYKEKSIDLYNKVLSASESPSDSATVYNNMSNVYKDHEEFLKAQDVLLKAKSTIPRIKDSLQHALILDNLGFVKSHLNRSDGLPLMMKALEIRESIKDTSTIYTSYSHLAQYYLRNGNAIKSKEYALTAYDIAKRINSPAYEQNALSLMTDLSLDKYAVEYKKLNDSLYKAEKESTNKFALQKYDLSESIRKITESELSEEKQRNLKIISLSISAIILLVSVLLYFIINSKHKKEKLKEVYNTESRISKKVHDEVANDVFQLMTKLEHEAQIDPEVINELNSLYARTRDISKEHGTLNSDYPFIDYLGELIESFQDSQTNIIVKGLADISWNLLPEIQRITIYKVLQELLINMKKHSQASIVVLVFQKDKRKLNISYSDNGIGSALKKGNGIQNTENRIKSINGTIIFETEPNKGFKTKISI